MSQLTLDSEPKELPLTRAYPEKDLQPAEIRIYNYLLRMGPKSEIEIRRNPAFDNIADIGRTLRRLRSHKPPYVAAIPAQKGPQRWLILRWPARRSK